jgi:hypothetical protein
MLARGFQGRTVLLDARRLGAADLAFLAAGLIACAALRLLPVVAPR